MNASSHDDSPEMSGDESVDANPLSNTTEEICEETLHRVSCLCKLKLQHRGRRFLVYGPPSGAEDRQRLMPLCPE